jgi:ribosome-binding ATPase YchF (GTP1/OBG family)
MNDPRYVALLEFFKQTNSNYVVVDARIEEELKDMEGEEKAMFRNELGGKDDGINNLITEGYKMLNLITYFTTGEDETRAWTIGRG